MHADTSPSASNDRIKICMPAELKDFMVADWDHITKQKHLLQLPKPDTETVRYLLDDWKITRARQQRGKETAKQGSCSWNERILQRGSRELSALPVREASVQPADHQQPQAGLGNLWSRASSEASCQAAT